MKKRKIALILGLGAVTASTLVLTSCGGKESISFKSYSNEVSEADFISAAQAIDVADYTSYSATSYYYQEVSMSYDSIKTVMKEINKAEEKYNADDKVSYAKETSEESYESSGQEYVRKSTSERTCQVDGEKLYVADMQTKTYTERTSEYYDATYILDFENFDENDVSSEVGSFLNFNEAPVKYKYFKDGDVFTITAELDTEALSTYKETTKMDVSGSVKGTFQFYYANNELFYGSELEVDLTGKKTDEQAEGFKETVIKLSSAETATIKFEKPSVSKVDLSKYTKYNNYYN